MLFSRTVRVRKAFLVRKQVAAMISARDGADLIVFTGGITEYDQEARAAACPGSASASMKLGSVREQTIPDQRSRIVLFYPGSHRKTSRSP